MITLKKLNKKLLYFYKKRLIFYKIISVKCISKKSVIDIPTDRQIYIHHTYIPTDKAIHRGAPLLKRTYIFYYSPNPENISILGSAAVLLKFALTCQIHSPLNGILGCLNFVQYYGCMIYFNVNLWFCQFLIYQKLTDLLSN